MNEISILRSWPKWPNYGQNEIQAVERVIKSNQLFAAKEVKAFEEEFSLFLGIRHSIGVGNATQGLHVALAAAGVGLGDEVIVTNCSWISTASCILMQNAVPIFIDIEKDTLGIDPALLSRALSPRTKAIIAAHILGYPSRIDEIRRFANENNLLLIEDASHAPGAQLANKKIGTFGDISVFSLHQRKAISTGDGGMICTNNEDYAEKMRRLRSFGDNELSYNYRMTEFSAALGRVGLAKLERDNAHRRSCATYLSTLFAQHQGARVRLTRESEIGVYYAIALEVNLNDEMSGMVLQKLTDLGVPMRKLFSPLNLHPHFSNNPYPARGLPWRQPDYNGHMKNMKYSELDFPVSYEYCNGRVLELYTHPGTDPTHLDAFANIFFEEYDLISKNSSRQYWAN